MQESECWKYAINMSAIMECVEIILGRDFMLKLIVDSTCDMDEEMRKDLNVLPLSIIMDDIPYLDGIEVETKRVYDYMREGKLPKTSQISYIHLLAILMEIAANKDEAIYLTFSSKMSGSHDLARNTAREFLENNPGIRVEVVDSEGGSGGSSLLTLHTLEMIKKGLGIDEVLRNIEDMKKCIKYHFTLQDIAWLAKGGRVNTALSTVGDMLDMKPYLTVREGRIVVERLVRGRKKALRKIADDIAADAKAYPDQLITISHGDDLESARILEKYIMDLLPNAKTRILSIGSVLGAHIGVGGVAAFCLTRRPPYEEG
jgi:DegV family protein with EDD domain